MIRPQRQYLVSSNAIYNLSINSHTVHYHITHDCDNEA